MNSKSYPSEGRHSLRPRLSNFYAVLDAVCMGMATKEGFGLACQGLVQDLNVILSELANLEEIYSHELPVVADKPVDIDWESEKETLLEYQKKLQTHEFYRKPESEYLYAKFEDVDLEAGFEGVPLIKDDSIFAHIPTFYASDPTFLSTVIENIINRIEQIQEVLHPLDDAEIFCDYCNRELAQYNVRGWKKSMNALLDAVACETMLHQNEMYSKMLDEAYDTLQKLAPHCLDREKAILYREGLGRLFWRMAQTSNDERNLQEALRTVKTVEYLSKRLEREFAFLDKETSPIEEADEKVRLANLKEQIKQNEWQIAKLRTRMCECHLAKGYDGKWIEEFWVEAINSEISDALCQKLKKRNLWKTIHQIVGELYSAGVFVECTQGDLVDKIAFNGRRPNKQSRQDYLRKGVDDVPTIGKWVREYVTRTSVTPPNRPVGTEAGETGTEVAS